MRDAERALAARRALVRAHGGGGEPQDGGSEARLREVVAEVGRLDAELEALSDALADFSRRWERAVGAAFAELSRAEAVVRRLQRLEAGLADLARALAEGARAPVLRRRPRRGRRATGRGAPRAAWPFEAREPGPAPEAEAEGAAAAAAEEPAVLPAEVALKRLYRRLARALHPDLAPEGADRARLGDLMARVNAAYAKGDLTALEVMAEKVGAGEPPGELSPSEREAHLARRIETLARIAASLARERDRLVRSETHRLREEALRREAAGEDLLAAAATEAEEDAVHAWEDARARLGRLGQAARAVARARSTAMKAMEKRGPTGARRAFDPLAESELVRRGAARLDRARATAAARELARTLEARAGEAPWEVALGLLAFLAEESGGRPPDALATGDGWAERWDRLRAAWPGAPDLARALGRLPRWLAVGARTQGEDVVAGVQLASADLAAGVRLALDAPPVARLAREVLAALGPDLACGACRARGPGLHLHRTRGLDELHGVACPACGAIARSYWRYGEADGLEALAPLALRLGLVAEATAQLAGTAIGFGMTPAEREVLTAAGLRRRFVELYLAPCEVELAPSAIVLAAGKVALSPGARVGPEARLRFSVAPGAGITDAELLELLRARIERRFRPG